MRLYPAVRILSPAVTIPAPDDDLYAVLGVPHVAPRMVIRDAHRRIIRESHPDLVGDSTATERTVRANAAWAVLKDPVRRAAYDRRRASRDAGPSTAADDGSGSDGQVPSWGPGGVRPVSVAQLREAAARESAYSVIGRTQRAAFSAASRRIGAGIVLVGTIVLLLVALR